MADMDGWSFPDPSEFADEAPFKCEACGNGFCDEIDYQFHQCQADLANLIAAEQVINRIPEHHIY